MPTTYYLKATGSDAADGLSDATAWGTLAKVNGSTFAPGDAIRFRGGDTFSGTLTVPSSGASGFGNDIRFASYGTGKAVISGGNSPALSAENKSYFVLDNLQMVSNAPDASNVGGNQSGTLFIKATTATGARYPGVRIINSLITGGSVSTFFQVPDATSDGFDDLLVTDNEISGASGFAFFSFTVAGTATRRTNLTNAYIARNVVHDVTGSTAGQGSGIVLGYCTGGIIERNLVYDCGASTANQVAGSAGIFPHTSDGIIVQHNEVHHVSAGTNSNDGVGLDIDIRCVNCVLQYNYSHNNGGAGYLLCDKEGGTNNTVRFNLSVNDCEGRNNDAAIRVSGGSNPRVYNNTIIVSENNTPPGISVGMDGDNITGAKIFNNLIMTTRGAALVVGAGSAASTTVRGNCYRSAGGFRAVWGSTTYADLAAFRSATGQETGAGTIASPLLANPALVPVTGGVDGIEGIASVRPISGSPLLGAGLDLQTIYGINPGTQDFCGSALPSSGYAIGACNTVGATALSPYDTAAVNDLPAAYWPMQETSGTAAADLTGGHTGSYNNVTLNQAGYNGSKAVLLAGTDASFLDGGAGNVADYCAGMTSVLWVRPTAYGGIGVARWGGDGTTQQFICYLGGDGSFLFGVQANGQYLLGHVAAGAMALNQWSRVTLKWLGGSTLAANVNGTPQSISYDNTNSVDYLRPVTGEHTKVGASASGLMARAAVYPYALTDQQDASQYSAASAPVITSAATAGGTVGTAFGVSITASNSPASYAASGLPAGASVNVSTGLISFPGTLAAGVYTMTVSATNAGGTGSATLTLTIAAVPDPTPTPGSGSEFKLTRLSPGESISGKITAANFPNGAKRGQIVQIDASASVGAAHGVSDKVQIKFATGVRGYHLDRNMIVAEEYPLASEVFDPEFEMPELIYAGAMVDDPATATPEQKIGYVSARRALEFEAEGPDYLLLSSGLGALGADTAVGTKLGAAGGKLRVAQSGDEVQGVLRAHLVPKYAANTTRLLVESARN